MSQWHDIVVGKHSDARCKTPGTWWLARLRRKNTLWLCPVCGQIWALKYSTNIPDDAYGAYGEGVWWNWFRWDIIERKIVYPNDGELIKPRGKVDDTK